ncbi:MAG: hypothetical protein Q4C49_10420 [Bacillota bacterium]|nr:hypothetical protein [Bacillota bacterium]
MNNRKWEFEVVKLIYLAYPVLMKIAKEIYLRANNIYLKFLVVFFLLTIYFLGLYYLNKVEKKYHK